MYLQDCDSFAPFQEQEKQMQGLRQEAEAARQKMEASFDELAGSQQVERTHHFACSDALIPRKYTCAFVL
jgi:hypothetical protein